MGRSTTKILVTDFYEPEFFAESIKELTEQFDNWQSSTEHGREQQWSVLGMTYELADRLEKDRREKWQLIQKVMKLPGVQESERWQASKRHSRELLIILLLGIDEERKGTRSHWLSAFKAADKERVQPKRDAFVAFLKDVGGVEGARKKVAKPKRPAPTFQQLAQDMNVFESGDAAQFVSPDQFTEAPILPEGIGLVLVKGDAAGGSVEALATVVDAKIIEKVMLHLRSEDAKRMKLRERGIRDEEDEARKPIHDEAKAWKARLSAEYQVWKKSPAGRKSGLKLAQYIDGQTVANDELRAAIDREPEICLLLTGKPAGWGDGNESDQED